VRGHRGRPDPREVPGGYGRGTESDQEAARREQDNPIDMSPERIEADVAIIDSANYPDGYGGVWRSG